MMNKAASRKMAPITPRVAECFLCKMPVVNFQDVPGMSPNQRMASNTCTAVRVIEMLIWHTSKALHDIIQFQIPPQLQHHLQVPFQHHRPHPNKHHVANKLHHSTGRFHQWGAVSPVKEFSLGGKR
ncbi:hypothetical protein Pelo_3167 [Pelomyxa schiedti]|nr:hypothetical protein Pelo_3167 [Pelomyxa schiedti]